MSIDNFAAAGRQNGHLKAKFLNGGTHSTDGMIVPAGIVGIGDQFLDGPVYELEVRRIALVVHHRPSTTIFSQPSRILSAVSSLTCSVTTAPMRSRMSCICCRVQTLLLRRLRSIAVPISSTSFATTSMSGSSAGRDASAAI